MNEDAALQDVFATATLAGLYFDQGAYREAAEIYKKLLVKNPFHQENQMRLERALSAMHGESAALKSVHTGTNTVADDREWKIAHLQAWLNNIQMEHHV